MLNVHEAAPKRETLDQVAANVWVNQNDVVDHVCRKSALTVGLNAQLAVQENHNVAIDVFDEINVVVDDRPDATAEKANPDV
jgi:uncharacterized membrane protein YpjA